jgi:translocation and assembly module TamA
MERKYDQLCYTGCQSRLYTISEMGGMFNLQYKGSNILADVKGGWKKIKIYNLFEAAARAICFSPFLIGYSEPFFILEPQLTIEQVDNTMNPTFGFISRLYVNAKFPLDLHSTRLVRCLFEQSFFVPFAAQLVGAVRARLGHIFSSSFERLLPSERFYLGGPCTVRSYQQDFVAPVACYEEKGVTQWAPQGSRTMFNLNFELRGSLNKNLGVVLFYDNGFLRHEGSYDRHFCCGHAIGGGFRYLTPLGPLRFDIGWKGKYYPADRSSLAWFLSVGHAF